LSDDTTVRWGAGGAASGALLRVDRCLRCGRIVREDRCVGLRVVTWAEPCACADQKQDGVSAPVPFFALKEMAK
jgi:hypothetical protein